MTKFNSIMFMGMSFWVMNAYGMTIQHHYDLDQERAKNETLFVDGTSVATMEADFRARHPQAPDLLLTNQAILMSTSQDLGEFVAHCVLGGKPTSTITKSAVQNSSVAAMNWAWLHEMGHAQMPYNTQSIQCFVAFVNCATLYYWGAHRAVPYVYKNRFTKIGSKALASVTAGAMCNVLLMRAEERRADNWANAHANKEELVGGVEYLSNFKEHLRAIHEADKFKLPFSVAQHVMDPIHPAVESRLQKIRTALMERFGVEA